MDLRACACGSGLRHLRCCGLDLGTLSPPGASEPLRPLLAEAQAAMAAQPERAEAALLALLELAPGFEEALRLLATLRARQGRAAAEEVLLRRIVAINPNNFSATNDLALLLLRTGRAAEAETHARNGLRIAPREAQAHNLLGLVLTEIGRPHAGEHHYRQVLTLVAQPDAGLLANLAWNLKSQGRAAESRAMYEQAAARDPNLYQTWLGWARLEEADRRLDRARELLEHAAKLAPEDPGVRMMSAILTAREGRPEAALAEIDRLGEHGGRELGANEWMEKGRLLDQLGRTEEAFAAFTAGKAKARAALGHGYLAEQAAEQARRLRGFFTAERLAFIPRARPAPAGPQPIFVLGFPRSGTTLVEQMLSCHADISAGDELPIIHDLTQAIPRLLNSPLAYPEALSELWMAEQRTALDRLRDLYLEGARELGAAAPGEHRGGDAPGPTWFTDKMPLNETQLGLIGLLFPEAPLIHVLRHPLDVLLSVFANQLTHGFFCAFELEGVARHYALTMELVAHYRAEMTLRYLPLRYETLIADPQAAIRRVLAHIGAPFDPACLDFHANPRHARTASYAQVTEPLYDRSVFRYRRYLRALAPVIPLLEPVIARLGYRIETGDHRLGEHRAAPA